MRLYPWRLIKRLLICIRVSLVLALTVLAFGTFAYCGEIHDASARGKVSTVRALLKGNPDLVSSTDNIGRTPLYLAAYQGLRELAELLLADKAEVDTPDSGGSTPLHAAAFQGHEDMAELLLARGAAVNATNKNGETPLHLAITRGKRDVAEFLILNHADVSAKDSRGRAPSDLTAPDGQKVVSELMVINAAIRAHRPPDLMAGSTHVVGKKRVNVETRRPGRITPSCHDPEGIGCFDDPNSLLDFSDLRFAVYQTAALMHLGDVTVLGGYGTTSAPYKVKASSPVVLEYPTEVRSESYSATITWRDRSIGDRWAGENLAARLDHLPSGGTFTAHVDTSALLSRFLSETGCTGDALRMLNAEVSLWKNGDRATLARVATEAKDGYLRGAAITRLTDQVALAHVALEDEWEINRYIATRRMLYQAVLGGVAVGDDSPQVRRLAISKLTDQAVLTKLAQENDLPELRSAATARLTNQVALGKIVATDKDASVRFAAVENLTDRTTLARILTGKDKGLRFSAAMHLAIYAARDGDLEALKTILKEYLDLVLAVQNGCSLLGWAAHDGRKEVTELLLTRGARVNQATLCPAMDASKYLTPSQYASAQGDGEMVEFLHRHGGH